MCKIPREYGEGIPSRDDSSKFLHAFIDNINALHVFIVSDSKCLFFKVSTIICDDRKKTY